MSDPFFISCVIQSDYEGKDLTTDEGVVNAVHHEITDRKSEMSMTWGEYIELSLRRINTVNSKHILLHLSKHPERDRTPRELRMELGLDIDEKEIHHLLRIMVKADLIREGTLDIDYRGLTDGTLNLILRHRFEKEIATFQPDLRKNFHEELERLRKERKSLRGMVSHLSGMMAEYQLATEFRSRKRFSLSRHFENVSEDAELNITDVRMRVRFQRADGKGMEMDVLAESECGRMLAVEVKKTKTPVGLTPVRDFLEKIAVYADQHPDQQMVPAFFSTGGFTDKAQDFCKKNRIATAQEIRVVCDNWILSL